VAATSLASVGFTILSRKNGQIAQALAVLASVISAYGLLPYVQGSNHRSAALATHTLWVRVSLSTGGNIQSSQPWRAVWNRCALSSGWHLLGDSHRDVAWTLSKLFVRIVHKSCRHENGRGTALLLHGIVDNGAGIDQELDHTLAMAQTWNEIGIVRLHLNPVRARGHAACTEQSGMRVPTVVRDNWEWQLPFSNDLRIALGEMRAILVDRCVGMADFYRTVLYTVVHTLDHCYCYTRVQCFSSAWISPRNCARSHSDPCSESSIAAHFWYDHVDGGRSTRHGKPRDRQRRRRRLVV
jgi:hypothetical protein